MDLRATRRQQTLHEADRLATELDAWIEKRVARDTDATGTRGRYKSQLDSISSEVRAAARKVREIAAAEDVTMRPLGEVFSDYNLHDQRLVWIRYTWSYFRDKLDQRDDETLRPILEAADEVSWTCYSIFFRQAGMPIPTAPVPYIEYDYVASALRTSQVHVLSRRPGPVAGPLKAYFESLPVPLLRLPPVAVTSPWWLSLIAHEVGHLLQASVEPAQQYFVTFSNRVREKAAAGGATEDEQTRWGAWAQEIFADLCMALSLGPWSVWALAPWVMTRDAAMTAPLDYYPPPAVRLYLLRQFAQEAQFDPADSIGARLGLRANEPGAEKAVAVLAAENIAVNGRTRPLGWFLRSTPGVLKGAGRAAMWSDALVAGREILAENDRTSARDAALAATRAHFLALQNGLPPAARPSVSGAHMHEGEQDEDLDGAAIEELAKRCVDLMRSCHDTGVRAGSQPEAPKQPLADAVFQIQDDELLGAGPSSPFDLSKT